MSEMKVKVSLDCGRIHFRALKNQTPPARTTPTPPPRIHTGTTVNGWAVRILLECILVHFTFYSCHSMLHYVSNFRSRKLPPTPDQILDPHLTWLISVRALLLLHNFILIISHSHSFCPLIQGQFSIIGLLTTWTEKTQNQSRQQVVSRMHWSEGSYL